MISGSPISAVPISADPIPVASVFFVFYQLPILMFGKPQVVSY